MSRAVTIGLLLILAAAGAGGCDGPALGGWRTDATCYQSASTDYILGQHGSRPNRARHAFNDTVMVCTRTAR